MIMRMGQHSLEVVGERKRYEIVNWDDGRKNGLRNS